MKKKYLVIFFILCLLLYLIYNKTYDKKKSILFLGDNYLLSNKNYINYFDKDKYNINTFLYDKINYKQLGLMLKYNDNILIKNKKVYMTQLISNSDIIIINANNHEYLNKCVKNERIFNNYSDLMYKNVNILVNKIKKISSAKIIILGNFCDNEYTFQYNNDGVKFVKLSTNDDALQIYNKLIYEVNY